MASEEAGLGYRIWAADNVVYGPVELPALVNWIKDERVLSHTWVFSEKDDCWRKAAVVSELRMFFEKSASAREPAPGASSLALKPAALRRVKILADLGDAQLERLMAYTEPQRVKQWEQVVRQGDHGDAMFMVLEGELRVRLLVAGKDTTLATLGPGEFFGEISLFDHGPRSADVLANADSLLLKLSAASFAQLAQEAPDIAAPFLLSIGKTLTARIRADNKRYRDSIMFATAAGQ